MSCINHQNGEDPQCPMCAVEQVRKENRHLKEKVRKFYQWFRMPAEKVDALLEKLPDE